MFTKKLPQKFCQFKLFSYLCITKQIKQNKIMKKVNELLNEITPIRREIKKRCLAYLKRTLKKAENNRLDFYDEDGEAYGNQFLSVSYDGGRRQSMQVTLLVACTESISTTRAKSFLTQKMMMNMTSKT